MLSVYVMNLYTNLRSRIFKKAFQKTIDRLILYICIYITLKIIFTLKSNFVNLSKRFVDFVEEIPPKRNY